MKRTYEEINKKILDNKAQVLTAKEAKKFIKENGVKKFLNEVDIVTTASFEINTNALLYMSLGQTDPMIFFANTKINGVDTYPSGATDLILSSVAHSEDNIKYGGANIIEELISGKDLQLSATGRGYETFPLKEFETWFNKNDLNQGKLLLNQALNQNSIVACNSGEKDINSQHGTLLGKLENSTFNSSSFLNPLINDPFLRTIGIGSTIWVAGGRGIVLGSGSNHNPKQKRNEYNIPIGQSATLSCIVDISSLNKNWIKAGYINSFGHVLYVGIGIPIPILDIEIAEGISIQDENIHTTIIDFSIPRRSKPTFGKCTYAELRTSTVNINNKPTLTAPYISMAYSIEICNEIKNEILSKNFLLEEPYGKINLNSELKKLEMKLSENA